MSSSDTHSTPGTQLHRRTALSILVGLGTLLAGVVLYDMYADWALEGNPLWSTVVENIVPLALALSVPVAGWSLNRRSSRTLYLSKTATWALGACAVTIVVAGTVIGIQLLQGKLKPGLIVVQLATAGAVAGLFVGYSAAETTHARNRAQAQKRRLQGIANSVPGCIYQFEVLPSGEQTFTFVSEQAEDLLGISADPEGYFERFVAQVPESHREELLQSIEHTVENAEPWSFEMPFDRPDGDRIWVRAISTPERQQTDGGEKLVYHGVVLDITDRREAERRYEAIFNQTFQLTGLMEPDGTLIEANDSALSVAGLSEDEVLGKPFWETYWFQTDEQTPKKVRESVRRAAEGEFVRYEETIQSQEGPRVVDFSIRPLPNEQGEVSLLIPEGRDITELRQRERQMERWVRAMEAASDGMAVLDADGTYTFVNEAHARIYGYEDPEALLGESWRMCYGDDELQRFEEEVLPTLYDEGKWRGEALGQRADGRWFPQELTLTALDDGGIVCVVRDITDRKRRTRKLRQREAALRQAGEAVLITEADPIDEPGPRIVYVNEAFEEMSGYSEEEIVGKTPRVLQGPETDRDVLESLKDALEAGEDWQGETVNYRKDGSPYVVNWTVGPVRDSDGSIQHWVSVQRDVTDLRRRQRQLKAAKEEAEEASRLKSALLANMSHEFRTPLTSIIGFAGAVGQEASAEIEKREDEKVPPALESARRFSGLIEKSGERLLDTLTSVLKLSRLEAGEVEFEPEPCNLGKTLKNVSGPIRAEATEADVQFRVDFPTEPVWGRADDEGLRIALKKLLDNAIKFTEPGGQVVLRARENGDKAAIDVEDTGIGMEPERVEELFGAFKQASEGHDREYEGSGLGLTVAKDLVEKMGGALEVETEKGIGARFRILIPVAAPQSTATLGRTDA